jgi:CRP/FNR family transcriptional regulator, cyclic AMP receptor protein
VSAASPVELLATAPLFAGLGREELADLAGVAQPFRRLRGELLFQHGEPADGLYVVESGRLESVARLPAERELSLAAIGPGEVIGELALLSGGRRTATVRAVEATAGVVIERGAFDSLRASYRPGARAVMRRLCGVVCDRLRRRYATIGQRLGEDTERALPPPVRPEVGAVTETERRYASRLPFFSRFPAGDLERLLTDMGRLELARGDLLVRAGDRPDALYLTLRGAVEATIQRRERKQRVRLAGPGTACAYLGLIDEGPGPVDCRARERAVVLASPRVCVRELLVAHDPLAHRFLDAVQQDLVQALRDAERRQATLISAPLSCSVGAADADRTQRAS